MNFFDRLVDHALQSREDLALLRPVVEKELLHHDIFRELSGAGLLAALTLVDSSCLRACHEYDCLTEDLVFAGGSGLQQSDLVQFGNRVKEVIHTRHGLMVTVSVPTLDESEPTTWKLTVETRPRKKNQPAQHIHLDICDIPSHDRRPMMLRNLYGIDHGASGLIVQTRSREEIMADKVLALAFGPPQLKNRHLWDLGWFVQQGVDLPSALIPVKIHDHRRNGDAFSAQLRSRIKELANQHTCREGFYRDMQQFLPSSLARETLEKDDYWAYLTQVIEDVVDKALAALV